MSEVMGFLLHWQPTVFLSELWPWSKRPLTTALEQMTHHYHGWSLFLDVPWTHFMTLDKSLWDTELVLKNKQTCGH